MTSTASATTNVAGESPADIPTPRRTAGKPRRASRPMSAQERKNLGADAVKLYAELRSIRAVANEVDRSYGLIHTLLSEADVELQPQGSRRTNNRR